MNKNSKFFELIAVAVATGKSVKDAANDCGCSESHGYHLSKSPEFKSRVYEIRSSLVRDCVGRLTQGALTAADVLIELMGSGNEPKDRLNAAKAIFSYVVQISELGELRSRIDELEKAK